MNFAQAYSNVKQDDEYSKALKETFELLGDIEETLNKGHGKSCAGKKAPDTTDWTALKHQYVGMALTGLLAGNNTEYGSVIDAAIHLAELAVKKLKEKA